MANHILKKRQKILYLQVLLEVSFECEGDVAVWAFEGFDTGVDQLVCVQARSLGELLLTYITLVCLLHLYVHVYVYY